MGTIECLLDKDEGNKTKENIQDHLVRVPIRTMLKSISFCILLLVVAASGCIGRPWVSGRHSSGFQHAIKALFDVAREGHKCVTWELLLKHTAPEETWPISRDELHALFDDIDSDNDTCVTWKEVDSYDGWTA